MSLFSSPDTIIDTWEHHVEWQKGDIDNTIDNAIQIIPDGCRDVISITKPSDQTHWLVSELFDTAHAPSSIANGNMMRGYRFHPDVTLNASVLLVQLANIASCDESIVLPLIDAQSRRNPNIAEALQQQLAQAAYA